MGVEHRVRSGRGDPLDRLAIVQVVERVVLLADDRPAIGRDGLPDARVEHVRPDVVGGRQVEGPRPGLAHQPGNERVHLLRGHRAGAEDERVGLLALVLLGIDVERLALGDGRLLDGLPRGAVDAAEDDVDLIALDELLRLGGRDRVVGRAVLEMQLDVAPQQAALRIDVADDHPGHVGVREPDERERAALVGDDSHLDGIAGMDW
jgi:hypothetical protein